MTSSVCTPLRYFCCRKKELLARWKLEADGVVGVWRFRSTEWLGEETYHMGALVVENGLVLKKTSWVTRESSS